MTLVCRYSINEQSMDYEGTLGDVGIAGHPRLWSVRVYYINTSSLELTNSHTRLSDEYEWFLNALPDLSIRIAGIFLDGGDH